MVCQHGGLECQLNRFLACAVKETSGIVAKLLPFVACVEASYEGAVAEQLAQSCASSNGLSFTDLKTCYDGDAGNIALREQAMATPAHPGVPYILVDGKVLDDTNALLHSVCSAYKGPAPTGCKGIELVESDTFVRLLI